MKGPLFTDLYQFTNAYNLWLAGKAFDNAVFEAYIRSTPFKCDFCVFAGIYDVVSYLESYKFSEVDLQFIKDKCLPYAEEGFFDVLRDLNVCEVLKMSSFPEGEIFLENEPVLVVEGPVFVCMLLETPILNMLGFASLVATNAARMRLSVTRVDGSRPLLMEFGLRRAQGDGLSASKYSYLGGFDATSNVLAAALYDIPIRGTMSHAFVCSFDGCESVPGKVIQIRERVMEIVNVNVRPNDGELAAFYACKNQPNFIALIDTYSCLKSGLINFLAVAVWLKMSGNFKPMGVRIDSGDLTQLVLSIKKTFTTIADSFKIKFDDLNIFCSGDLNDDTLQELTKKRVPIDGYGVGTKLVTCSDQSSLGMVYKICEINYKPVSKISSDDVAKQSLPGRKTVLRLEDDSSVKDVILCSTEDLSSYLTHGYKRMHVDIFPNGVKDTNHVSRRRCLDRLTIRLTKFSVELSPKMVANQVNASISL